jgi:hypothetical protein
LSAPYPRRFSVKPHGLSGFNVSSRTRRADGDRPNAA